MTLPKKISLVCRGTIKERLEIVAQWWLKVFDEYPDSSAIMDTVHKYELKSLKEERCSLIYCPAYHICPFDDSVRVFGNVLGRKKFSHHKVSAEETSTGLVITVDPLQNTSTSPGGVSTLAIRDTVVEEVVRGGADASDVL